MLPNDPFMLLSVVNMKLRDEYTDLDCLCEDLGVSKEEIIAKLADIGYEYTEDANAFR